MVDLGFDDFLDSDDDEFLREASNHFLDYESNSESSQAKDTNVPSFQSPPVVSSYFDLSAAKAFESDTLSEPCKVTLPLKRPSKSDVTAENNITDSQVSSDSCADVPSKKNIVTPKLTVERNEHFVCNKAPSLESENSKKSAATPSTSSENSTFSTFPESNKTPTSIISPFINNRFTPGFTPKAKKRKLPGPAGFFEFVDESKVPEENDSNKVLSLDMEYQNVVSSQYTPEHLTLSSWQKLQTAVSSCSNLHSTAKYYSIQRVLSESAKKKLPKHMVVPVLCVLLKKLSNKGSTTPILMDDTGEIHGKIDAEVFSLYKEFLVEGAAFILKKVTFLCNVLILKAQNLVSMYHPNGTEKHLLSLESILDTSEPLKPMNCECLKLSLVKNSLHKTPPVNTPINHTSACIAHSQKKLNNVSTAFKTPHNNTVTNREKFSYTNNVKNSFSNCSRNASSSHSEPSSSNSELSSHGKSMRSNAFLENLLEEEDGMDDFDELLGNIDENSFMEDL